MMLSNAALPHEPEVEEALREQFDAIADVAKKDPKKGIAEYEAVLKAADPANNGEVTRFQEWSIFHLAALHAKLGETDALVKLLASVRPLFEHLPKVGYFCLFFIYFFGGGP